MDPEALFKKFPDLLLSNFRDQMLLGKIPAEIVRIVLEPLLSNFHELMLQLPAGLQTDFENILRIYPDVGELFGVWIKPSILESLRLFAQCRLKSQSCPVETELEEAAESQMVLDGPIRPFVKEGQGFFRTDRGNSVYLELFYVQGEDCPSFQYKPPKFEVEIHICGIHALTLTPSRPKQKIPVDELFKTLTKCTGTVDVKVIEPGSDPPERKVSSIPAGKGMNRSG